MNLSMLSDSQLLLQTKSLVAEARELLTKILFHLREVERRRLYCDLGYSSLLTYAIEELKYSEAEAIRRISAMRLLRDIPEVEQKINTGVISLTNLAMAQSMFSKEKKAGRAKSAQQKIEVLQKLEHKTTRQVQKILGDESPLMASKRPLNLNDIASDEVRTKLLHVQGLLAHAHPNLSLEQLLSILCDREIKRQTEIKTIAKSKKSCSKSQVANSSTGMGNADASTALQANTDSCPNARTSSYNKISYVNVAEIPFAQQVSQAQIIREVWARDSLKCSQCSGTFALEIDHIIPKAMNGLSNQQNLRVLCRACNQRAAIKSLGLQYMDAYLEPEPCTSIEAS